MTQWEKLNGVTETCTRHVETREITSEVTECTETLEIEERLHGGDGVKEDEHTHIELARDNGGELAQCVETRCGQLGVLLQEQRETLCSLEVDHDQAGPVVPRKVEGTSAVDGCTSSLGGMEAPGALVVTRFPSVNVPVCVHECVEMRAATHA